MISFIKGVVESIEADSIIIESRDIGYKVLTSFQTSILFNEGDEIKLYTQMVIRENDLFLVGFAAKEEQVMYKLLTSVSGVGPRGALSILSIAAYRELVAGILSGDVKMLSSASGIGKKTAEKIIIDLSDKVEKIGFINCNKDSSAAIHTKSELNTSKAEREAVEALVVLGYTKREIEDIMSKLDMTDKSTEVIIKEVLSKN